MKRRTVIMGAGIAGAGVALLAGVGAWRVGLFQPYPPTPYDDLLDQLDDRGATIALGKHVQDGADPRALAGTLRGHIGTGGLAQAVAGDVTAGRMTQVDGWILPRTVAQMAWLAAHA